MNIEQRTQRRVKFGPQGMNLLELRGRLRRGPNLQLGRWCFWVGWEHDYQGDFGWHRLHVVWCKPHTEPECGEEWTHRKHYRGVWCQFQAWFPFRVRRWR